MYLILNLTQRSQHVLKIIKDEILKTYLSEPVFWFFVERVKAEIRSDKDRSPVNI